MNRFDLCANSATLSEEQKNFANQALWNKLEQVEALYRRHDASGNVFLGGSVGLRQPAVKINNGRTIELKSDLDLFYQLQSLPPGPKDQAFLEGVAALPLDLEVSVHLIPAIHIDDQLYSPGYDDLIESLNHPVLEGFQFSPPEAAPRFESKTMALMAIRMAATAEAPHYVTSHQYANLPGDLIARDAGTMAKAAISFLRLPCYELLAQRFSYRELLRLADEGFFEGICSRELIHDVIKHREQVDLDQGPPAELDLFRLFLAVATRELGLPATSDTSRICREFTDRHCGESAYLDIVHALILPLTLWLGDPGPDLWAQATAQFQREDFQREKLGGDLQARLATLLATAKPSDAEVRSTLADLLHAAMKSVTDHVNFLVRQAYMRGRA